VKNVLFSFSKCEKLKSAETKTMCVTDFLTVRLTGMKDYTYHYVEST